MYNFFSFATKKKKYHSLGIIRKSIQIIVETEEKSIPLTRDLSLSLLVKGTSIKSGEVKLVL